MKVGEIVHCTCRSCAKGENHYIARDAKQTPRCKACGGPMVPRLEIPSPNQAPAIIGQEYSNEVDREPFGNYDYRKDIQLLLKSVEEKGQWKTRFNPAQRAKFLELYK